MMIGEKEPDHGIGIEFGSSRGAGAATGFVQLGAAAGERRASSASAQSAGVAYASGPAPAPDARADYQLIETPCRPRGTRRQASAAGSRSGKSNGTGRRGTTAPALEEELVPPDGGWGWWVLLGAVMVNVLIPGGIKCFGVLLANFVPMFEASKAKSSWIPAICYFLYSSLGPLSSILSVKYSYRTVTLIGGTFAAAGLIMSWWTPYNTYSIMYLCISYGVFMGIGAGLTFPPTVYIVTSYFVRLRGLANGLCISGSSLGSIILPRFIHYLLDTYNFRGTMLILGGITVNVLACALFYEPVERHLVRPRSSGGRVAASSEPSQGTPLAEVEIAVNSPTMSEDAQSKSPLLSGSAAMQNGDGSVPKSASSVALEYYRAPLQQPQFSSPGHLARTRKISVPVASPSPRYQSAVSQMHSTPALHVVPEQRGSVRTRKLTAPPLSPTASSFNYIHTPYHGSSLSAIDPQYASSLTLNALSSAFRKSPEKRPRDDKSPSPLDQEHLAELDEQSQAQKFFDLELLRDPMYLVILVSNSTNAISYTNFIIVLQMYVDALGYDWDKGFMLSIISAFDLAGRIGGAALSDTRLMPKHFYFVGGLVVSGVSLTLMPLADSYLLLAVCCGIFGLASGVYVGVTAVVMADMLGVEKLTSSYGISLFVNGVIQLVGPPIVGQTYEAIGDYGPIFSTLGLVLIAGAALWGFVPFIRRKQARERAKSISPP